MISDAFAILLDSARLLGRQSPAMLLLTIVGALVLAGAAWWGAVNYTKLWNLRFTPNALHHASCAFAAFLTLLFVIAFVSLGYAKQAATKQITAWQDQLIQNNKMIMALGGKVYVAVQQSGRETFTANHYNEPTGRGVSYPNSQEETRRLVSGIYTEAAIDDFRTRHPYLHRAIWTRSAVPYERVLEDRAGYKSADKPYPMYRYFVVAARQILNELEPRTPQVVGSARRWLMVFFLFAQAIPFCLIGWAAYQDLKEAY